MSFSEEISQMSLSIMMVFFNLLVLIRFHSKSQKLYRMTIVAEYILLVLSLGDLLFVNVYKFMDPYDVTGNNYRIFSFANILFIIYIIDTNILMKNKRR